VSRIKDEIRGKSLRVIFDGTTHICEALLLSFSLLVIHGLSSKG